MTASNLNRRTVLRASVAAVAIVAPTAALAATPADDGPLLALETRWRDTLAEQQRAHDAWVKIHDSLPEHAQGGCPRIPEDHPLFNGPHSVLLGLPGDAIPIKSIEKFNWQVEIFQQTVGATEARVAKSREEGAARIAWWNAINDEGKRLRDASGLDEAHDRCDAAYDSKVAVEKEIFATPCAGFDGIRVKLALLAHASFVENSNFENIPNPPEEWEWTDKMVCSLHAEAERITAQGNG
jgi:hypothetical protein